MGFHRETSNEAGTRATKGVGIGATRASKLAHDAPACPLSKFITTEANQGGVIALTTIKITRQHDIVSFSQATACRQILRSDGPLTGGEIEPAWENYYESQGYKPTATCKECGFKKLCVSDVAHAY